jgi:hypothetical protein
MAAAQVSVAEVAPAKDLSKMPLPISDASEYAGRWLLLLGRHETASVVLQNREELERSKAELKPAVVYTSRLDGLEPCMHVVVGRHFAMREEALYWSRFVERAGIPSEVVYAGALASLDPRIEARCEERFRTTTPECPDDVRLVIGAEGFSWIALPTTPTVYLPEADRWESVADGWIQTTSAKQARAAHGVPPQWTLYDEDGSTGVCRVQELAWRVLEVPHKRYAERGGPTCGQASLFARTSCAEGYVWGQPLDAPKIDHGVLTRDEDVTPSVLARVLVGVTSSNVYRAARSLGVRRIADQGLHLDEATSVSPVSMAAGGVYYGVESHLRSSDRGVACNTRDVDTRIFGVADENGSAALPYREIMTEPVALLDLSADGQLELVERDWTGGLAVRGGQAAPVCEVPVAYCASPCGGR